MVAWTEEISLKDMRNGKAFSVSIINYPVALVPTSIINYQCDIIFLFFFLSGVIISPWEGMSYLLLISHTPMLVYTCVVLTRHASLVVIYHAQLFFFCTSVRHPVSTKLSNNGQPYQLAKLLRLIQLSHKLLMGIEPDQLTNRYQMSVCSKVSF